MTRKKLIAANMKMNKTNSESVKLAEGILTQLKKTTAIDVVLCPNFTALFYVDRVIERTNILLGAQNISEKGSGAFTGEISATMLVDVGCSFVIIGHSERRQLFGEMDDQINIKVKRALASGLIPILCIGETKQQRDTGKTKEVLEQQITKDLAGIKGVKSIKRIVLAYEPVWAIGTGDVATPSYAQDIHAFIRDVMRKNYGVTADEIRIIYGGSVKPDNAGVLAKQPDIDGFLVGGASLEVASFVGIVKGSITSQ